MKYRRLGASALQVSELCLGTMMFGDQTAADEAASIVALARERGVNFVDTADVYMSGASESMLGPLIRGDRDRWVLATKVGNKMSNRPNESRYSRKWIVQSVEGSLARLGTDYLDIYYLHRDFESDSLEEPLRALDDLIRAGKIRCWGLSNFRGWRISEAVWLARDLNMPGPVVCQPYYNLLNRMPEVEILPACARYGLGVATYSPIARGVLTGKYDPSAPPPQGSRAARGDTRMHQTEWRPESLAIAQRLKEHAHGRHGNLLRLAVAWILANRTVSSVIAGPRTLAQFEDYFPALECAWSAEDEALVDSLVAPGHPSTPGYSDPSYPFYGRRI
ncbi:MAG TPA: aldo/keto reductase [Burkholderiaceae bacterium]|nr:aldo/keto reductase [Burkholderiaceae bacterium]